MAWYRNVRGVYHLEAGDWVKTGKAVCGQSIRHPAYTAQDLAEVRFTGQKACVPCIGDRVSVQRVCLNRDGYTSGGAYFGVGSPVYRWDAGDQHGWVRAVDRDDAKRQVSAKVPGARFWR